MTMRTALVKGNNGYSVKRYDDYDSNKAFADDLRGNGYKVLKVWAHNASESEINEWQMMNRK